MIIVRFGNLCICCKVRDFLSIRPYLFSFFYDSFLLFLIFLYLPFNPNGVNVQMKGYEGRKTTFLCIFLKKKLVYCLDVVIILYLCIRKKFSKTGNFWKCENKKVSRFVRLLEKRENQNRLKCSELEKYWWRICWTEENKKLSKSDKTSHRK